MNLRHVLLAGLSVALAPCHAASAGDEPDPSDVLREQGLRPVGSYWILSAEKEVQQALDALEPRQRELRQALKLREKYDQNLYRNRQALLAAIAEHRRLAALAYRAEDRDDVAAITARMAAIANQIDRMTLYLNDPGPGEQITRRIGQAADALYTDVHALRSLVDETQSRYAELAADEQVQSAIAQLAADKDRKVKLGPRGIFTKYLIELEHIEAAIQTEDIKLRADNGVFWIDVVLNGNTHTEMVFDTGASLISLPAELAQRAGVTLTDADPVIRMQVADGRTVEGRLVFLDEVRVGPFSIENVEAVISPNDLDQAPPLLGGSFLRNFTIDLNHAGGTLTLTQIASPDQPNPR